MSLINNYSLDPAVLYTLPELEVVCRRHLPGGQMPLQGPGEDDTVYRGCLIKVRQDA